MGTLVSALVHLAEDSSACFERTLDADGILLSNGVDRELVEALRVRDQARVSELLGSRTTVVCGLFAPEDAPERKEDDDESPGDEDEENNAPGARRKVS